MARVSDNFDRADSSNIGTDWIEDSGNVEITGNTLRQQTSGNVYRKTRFRTAMDSDDYDSEVDGRASVSSNGFGAFGRGAVSSAVTYYAFVGFGGDAFYLVEITTGTENVLATGSSCTANTTFNARVRCNGSTITGFRNDVSDGSASDSSLTTGAVGCMFYNVMDGANDWLDNFAAADLAVAAGGMPTGVLQPMGIVWEGTNMSV